MENHTYQFLKNLQRFDYTLSGFDPTWNILFPDKDEKWQYLHISKYRDTYYVNHLNGESGTLEAIPGESLKRNESYGFGEARPFHPDEEEKEEWLQLILSASDWLKVVEKDWVKTYLKVQTEYPFDYRYGTIPHSLVSETLSDVRQLDKELGAKQSKEFVQLVEDGFFNPFEQPTTDSMTAAHYFEYCKIAYLAIHSDLDGNLSGREMYQRFADGRHEGLLDIDPDSEEEFADWLDGKHPKRERGGHPWEIMRGGSFTHIGMRVMRPDHRSKNEFVVELYGTATNRLAETIKMFLAIHEAGLPIHIVESENNRKRLLSQDNIGIMPIYRSLMQGEQHFLSEEEVFDVIYYESLGKHRKKLMPFIRWEALPFLRLRGL